MLERPGDLIPILPEAAQLPWTRRRSQILSFLHRGPVTFSTLVYDTNVGDISTLSCYFNQERISVEELNKKYGHMPGELGKKIEKNTLGMPRLLLYPVKSTLSSSVQISDYTFNLEAKEQQESSWPPSCALKQTQQVTAQRTFDWVLSQKLKEVLKIQEEEEKLYPNTSSHNEPDELDAVVSAELVCQPEAELVDLAKDEPVCLPQSEPSLPQAEPSLPEDELDVCLPQDELDVCLPRDVLDVCLPQDDFVCFESENESSRVTTPDEMDSVFSDGLWSSIPKTSGSSSW